MLRHRAALGFAPAVDRKSMKCLGNFSDRLLETELVRRTRFRSRRKAKAALFEHIAIFSNRRRCHSSTGYRTPAQARIDTTTAMAAS